ncbi:MAG: ribulose-phosphate 3-epimerase [Planctomycetota bacterium]
MRPIKLAPSILNADYGCLREEIRKAEAGGADMIHVDVMDAHFVPNLSMGPAVVESLRRVTKLPIDVHLMVREPEKFVDPFASAGADSITFHAEAVAEDYALVHRGRGWAVQLVCRDFYDRKRLERTLEAIRARGKRAAVALNPGTDAEAVDFLDRVDMVLAMTVWPGFGGQKFIESVLSKVSKLRRRAPEADIQVDGGVDLETAAPAVAAGANVLVAGTAVFHAPDPAAALRAMRQKAEQVRGV